MTELNNCHIYSASWVGFAAHPEYHAANILPNRKQ